MASPTAARGAGRLASGSELTPAFRLVLRPNFVPWPLELQVGEVAGMLVEGGHRLAFFCAYQQMPAEPHACLYCYRPDRQALVLVSIRLDGQLEILSNSSEAAWEQAHTFLSQPGAPRSLSDFAIVTSGWHAAGVGVAAFGALVRTKWREWSEGRGKAAAERKDAERALAKRQAELHEWLVESGLTEWCACACACGMWNVECGMSMWHAALRPPPLPCATLPC